MYLGIERHSPQSRAAGKAACYCTYVLRTGALSDGFALGGEEIDL